MTPSEIMEIIKDMKTECTMVIENMCKLPSLDFDMMIDIREELNTVSELSESARLICQTKYGYKEGVRNVDV